MLFTENLQLTGFHAVYVPSRALKMTSSCRSTAQLPRKVWLLRNF